LEAVVTQKIQKMLQAQSWERLKAEFQQIIAVTHYDPNSDWSEWRSRCEKGEELFLAFVQVMEKEELHLF
jgi:hypothetical protein